MTPSPQRGTEVYGLPKRVPKRPSLPTLSSSSLAFAAASSFLDAEAWNWLRCSAEKGATWRAERRARVLAAEAIMMSLVFSSGVWWRDGGCFGGAQKVRILVYSYYEY